MSVRAFFFFFAIYLPLPDTFFIFSYTIIRTISLSGGICCPQMLIDTHTHTHTVVSIWAGCPLHAKLMRLARFHITNIGVNPSFILY